MRRLDSVGGLSRSKIRNVYRDNATAPTRGKTLVSQLSEGETSRESSKVDLFLYSFATICF